MSEALTIQRLSDALSNIFLSGQAGAARDFINAKVSTVLQHISKYTAPDPNDPRDRGDKKNIYNRMKNQLQQARDKLKRLSGKTAKSYEELIRRTEEQLENWWSGGAA